MNISDALAGSLTRAGPAACRDASPGASLPRAAAAAARDPTQDDTTNVRTKLAANFIIKEVFQMSSNKYIK